MRGSIRYKFGHQVPRNYEDEIDLELQQTHEYQVFRDLGKATDEKGKVTNLPSGYQKIQVHLVFAVKHDGRHKARLVADGHLTREPVETVYSGLVSLRNLRLTIFLSELNNLELWGADIGNAYLVTYTDENLCIVAGPEIGELPGHLLLINKALCGTRSAGSRWHDRCLMD